MLEALADAVAAANTTLHEMSVADPSTEGMGTTLTAHAVVGRPGGAVPHRRLPRLPAARRRLLPDHPRPHAGPVAGGRGPAQPGRRRPPTRSGRWSCARCDRHATPSRTCACARPWLGDRYLLCSDGLSDVVTERDPAQDPGVSYADPEQAVAAADRPGHPRRRPGQHHLHRGRRGGHRDRPGRPARPRCWSARPPTATAGPGCCTRQPGQPGAPADPGPRRQASGQRIRSRAPATAARRRRRADGPRPTRERPAAAAPVAAGHVDAGRAGAAGRRRRLRGLAEHPEPVLRGHRRRPGRHLPRHQPERGRASSLSSVVPARPASRSAQRASRTRCTVRATITSGTPGRAPRATVREHPALTTDSASRLQRGADVETDQPSRRRRQGRASGTSRRSRPSRSHSQQPTRQQPTRQPARTAVRARSDQAGA